MTTAGDGVITLAATAGNVNVAQAAAAAVTAVNGKIDVDAGTSVLLGHATPRAGQLVTTGTGAIDVDAATAITMAGTGSEINAGGAVNLGQNVEPVSITVAGSGITAVGAITADADDAITVNSPIESTLSIVNLEVSESGSAVGTITLSANVIGDNVTITASDAQATTALITVATALNNNRGGYAFEANDGTLDINDSISAQDFITLNGGLAVTLNNNLTAVDNDINVVDALTLDGASTVTATSGDVTFSSTIGGAQDLTVNALNGTVTFGSTVGAVTDELTSLTVNADTANLGGNISTDGGATADVNFTGTDDVVLTANVIIDTETGTSTIGGDILFKTTGTITGDFDLDLIATGTTDGTVQIATVDTNSLDINSTNTTTLYGNITADVDVSLDGATNVDLAADVAILGDGNTIVLLTGGDVTGDFDLSIDSGIGNVTLGAAAGNIDVDVNKLIVTTGIPGPGTVIIASDLRTDEGMDFGNADDVNIVAGVTLYNTDSGTVDLSGGDTDCAGALTINAYATNVTLDNMEITGAFDVDARGTTTLLDDISTTNSNVAFDGATNVVLGADVTITTNAGAGYIDFSNSAANSLSGGFDLTLTAGTGDVQLDNINDLTSLTVTSSSTTQLVGSTDMNGAIAVDATTLIDVDGSTITTGAITLDSDADVDIDGVLTAGGDIDIDADNDVAVDADVTVNGNSTITITADSGTADNSGDLNIAQAVAATITSNSGKITLEGEDINLGRITTFDYKGVVMSTGNGDIKITANREGTVGAGDFVIAGTGSEVNSGGSIDIDDPWDVTIGGDGLTAVDDITIVADNDIDINAPINSTMAGNIVMTALNNILLSDEVRTTSTGDITLTAQNAAKTAGYIYDDDTTTEDEYIACDTLTMTAALGIGITGLLTADELDTAANTITANTTGAGAASIDIHNVNAQYTTLGVVAGGVNNTIGTSADYTFYQSGGGGLFVEKVFTTDGDIIIDSSGAVSTPGIRVDFSVAHSGLGGINASRLTGTNGKVTLTTDAGGMVLGSVLADDTTPIATAAGITIIADIGDITIDVVGDRADVDIDITANNGYIDELVETGVPQDSGVDIMGRYVKLRSAIGIGKKYELEIDAVTLDATTSSSSGDVWISELNDVTVADVTTIDGTITIEAGGRITVTNVSAQGIGQDVNITSNNISGTDGNIYLTAVYADDDITVTTTAGTGTNVGWSSDIYVGVVGDSDTDNVTMTANDGSIFEQTPDSTINITGNLLTLTADNGIGGAGLSPDESIETNVTTLIADVRVAGGIYLTELDGAGNGINLQSVDTNSGDIVLITNGGTHEPEDETLVTDVRSDTDPLTLGTHDIFITAQTGDMTIEYVESDSDIALEATLGSITEINRGTNPAEATADIVSNDTAAGKLTITARDEIGSPGEEDIETTVAVLDASSISAGDIYITETDSIELLDVDTANGAINIVSGGAMIITDVASLTDLDANDITLTATTGDVTIDLVTAGAGVDADVSITATAGSITEIAPAEATVDITADVLTLSARDEIGAAGEGDIETTVNSITASSTLLGDIYITETNAITLTGVTTTDGLINIASGGAMTVTSVTAGGDTGSNDDVTLTTTVGDIIMSGDITALNDVVTLVSAADITDTTDATTDISAADLVLTVSAGTVGATGLNNELDTDVDTITAAVQGDTYILEQDAITLTSVVTTNGLVDIEAGGTITTGIVTAGGSNAVNLNSTGGDIVDTATGMITAGAASSLRASGIIGTTTNALDVNVNGDLWVWANSSTDQVSANLQGIVNGTGDTERVEIYDPSPPGLVLLDNRLMGGGNYGSGSANGSILSFGYGYSALAQFDVFGVSYAKALQPWGYKITLPWILYEGAKMDNDLLRPTPALIDAVQLNLPVLGVQNIMPSYYVIYPFAK